MPSTRINWKDVNDMITGKGRAGRASDRFPGTLGMAEYMLLTRAATRGAELAASLKAGPHSSSTPQCNCGGHHPEVV